MDDVSYGALALALTLAAGAYAWFSYQRRGLGAGLKGAGIAVLPIAAYLTKTLEMFGRIADAIGDWAVRLVFSPVVWVGIVLAGIGIVLYTVGRVIDQRGGGRPARTKSVEAGTAARSTASASALASAPASNRSGKHPAPVDDDLADIEALLKNRGIS